MKLKPFIRIRSGRISAGTTLVDDELRADMFLPAWMFVLGLLFVIFGMILGTVLLLLQISFLLVALAAALVVLGVTVLLWWKNQAIRIISDDTFLYSTFLGKKTLYRFDEIKGIKKGRDSTTLFVGDGKVYMDSVAIVSKRLEERINAQLDVRENQFR